MRTRPKITEYRFDRWADELRQWIQAAVSPFEADSVDRQQARVEQAGHDRLYFFQTYLPHYFHAEFGDFHQEWSGLCDIADQAVFIAAPREHAKSTFFTLGLPLHDLVFQRRWFILIVSDTNDQAVGFTLPIRMELEENPRLRHDFGDLEGPVWKKSDFTSRTGVRILARGRGEKVRGLKNRQHRPDRAIVDDFENDENVENPVLVKKGRQWLSRAVMGSMTRGYSFIMVGNLFHPKSILAQFMATKDDNGQSLYLNRTYAAIQDACSTPRPLWPAVWSLERLEAKRRQMGATDFNAEMMNMCAEENSPFPESRFKYFDRGLLGGRNLIIATFVDPSAKDGQANDFKAIVTVGLEREHMVYYCLHAWIRRASIGEMFAAAERIHAEYGGLIGIEDNMLHDFLHEAIHNHARQIGRYLPWRPVRHNTSKEARIIGTLSYLVEHGRLLFDQGHSDQALLIEQLIYLLNRNVHDDGPDALEGAVKLLQDAGGLPQVLSGSIPDRGFMRGYR